MQHGSADLDKKSKTEQFRAVATCSEQVRHTIQREERSRYCSLSKGAKQNNVRTTENKTELYKRERNTDTSHTTINKTCLDSTLRHERNSARLDEALPENRTNIANCDIQGSSYDIQGTSVSYRLGPALIKRLQDLLAAVRRTSSVLTNRKERQELDEEEDSDRANKRNVEFDTMFSRNHLYEVRRMLKEADQLTTRPVDATELESKSAAALKCVTRALHVYANRAAKGGTPDRRQLAPIFQAVSAINGMLERLSGHNDIPYCRDIEMASSYLNRVVFEMNSNGQNREPVRIQEALPKPSSDLSMYNRKNERRKKLVTNRAEMESSASKARLVEQKAKENVEDEVADESAIECVTSQSLKSQNGEKELIVGPVKSSDTKEVSFRNATRAVSEEQVRTMMETIPIESSEEFKLNLDDRTYQTLKFLRESCKPFQDNHFFVQGYEKRLRSGSDRPDSSESIDVFGRNIQLVCIREDETTCKESSSKEPSNGLNLDEGTLLSLNQTDETYFHDRRSSDLHMYCPQNTEGSVPTIEMLAKNILMDMIIQHQRGESDTIVEMLYNLDIK